MPAFRSHKPAVGLLGQRLRLARVGKRLSINELAVKVGVSESQITGVECRRTQPRLDILMAMAVALHVSLDWLCGMDVLTTTE